MTDGAIIYAWFSNSQLAAVDMSGKLVWSRHLGREYSAISVGVLELHFALEQHELRDFLQSRTLRGLRG